MKLYDTYQCINRNSINIEKYVLNTKYKYTISSIHIIIKHWSHLNNRFMHS